MRDQQENIERISAKPRKSYLVRLTHEEYKVLQLLRDVTAHAYNVGVKVGHASGKERGDRLVDSTISVLTGLDDHVRGRRRLDQ
jgi:hypothetical protein